MNTELPDEPDTYLVPCNSPDPKRAAHNRLKTWKAKHAPYISMLNKMYRDAPPNFDNAPPPLQTHKPLAKPKPRVLKEFIVGTSKPLVEDKMGWSMTPLPPLKPTRVLSKSYNMNMNNSMRKTFKSKRQV